jgi:PAS domain S-box-containing protein
METGTRECKLHYCTLATVLPVGLFHTDVAGHYLSVNQRWCEIAGIEAAEALGDGWVQVLFPSDRERVFAEWYRAVQENLPFRLQYRFQRPDGKIVWVLGQAVAEKDEFGAVTGYIGTITDLTDGQQTQGESSQYRHHLEQIVQERTTELREVKTQLQQEIAERQRLEEALRKSEQPYITQLQQAEERLRLTQEFVSKLLDHIPARIYLNTTPDQRFHLVNRAWEEFVGLRREQVINHSLDEVLPPVLAQQCLREQLVGAIAQRIHQSLNLEEILTTTTAEIRQFLDCDRVIIYRLHTDGSGTVVVESVGSEWRSIAGTKIHDCYFAQNYFQLYQEGRVQALEDIYTADLTPCHLDLLARFQVRANLVVPIVHDRQLWGLLVAQQCSETRQWQPVEIDLLHSLATQAAIAIHQSELYQQAQAEIAQRQQAEAALRQQILKERLMVAIAQRIRQSLNLEEILNITVAEVRQFLQTDRVLIYRLWPNGTGNAVTEAVVPGWPAVLGRTFPEEVFPQESQQLYCNGRIFALSDTEQAEVLPCLAEFVQQFGVKAKLVVPIVQEKTLWGLLIAHHCREPRQWQPLEIDLLKSLSTQLAIAIQQCQLYKQTQHQVHRAQALKRVIQTIRNSLDLTTIFATAVSEIAQLLETDRADIMQYLPEQKLWRFVATYPHIPNVSNPLPENIVDEDNEIAARLKRLEIVQINDASTCVDDANRDIPCSFSRAWLLVPLHFSGSVWGSLSLVRKAQPSSWKNSEIELACEVANQLAIALQQAELYEQSRTATAKALTQAQQLEQALSELQKAQAQLVQSEKMSSLGQLVAGVAHEINNPVTFVSANVVYVEEYIQDLLGLIKLYQQQYPNPTLDIQSAIDKIDLNFLVDDLPRLLCSMKVGADRICDIVSALRNFSRHAEAEIKAVDIHDGLDSTLMILQHRLRASGKNPGIEVIKEYGNLPKVECYAGQLNQVFMNLLTNAIDALEELVDSANTTENVGVSAVVEGALCDRTLQLTTDKTPLIRICTEVLDNEQVAIRIADNGLGMTEQVKARLFDPFFTTKPVGAGTGLGLSISYQIVVKKHGGQLHCFSERGQGTEFVIQIPLEPRPIGVPD